LDSAEEFARQQLIERLLAPDEPAALIAWLCTADASALTGAVLPADGGLTTS
jgi:NAD(P)-dependent dehydrogenase (short-subunit alcohol dehydrogenase family)